MKVIATQKYAIGGLLLAIAAGQMQAVGVTVWPAPEGEELSKDFIVAVERQVSPVYVARVAPGEPERRWKAMGDRQHPDAYYENAAFTSFDMDGPVHVTVTCPTPIHTARVLPSALGIVPQIQSNRLIIALSEPRLLTVEVNGDWVHSLHIFANLPEKNIPKPDDPNVIYFGPGIHEVHHLEIDSGKTLYLAGGSVIRGVVSPDDPSATTARGDRHYAPVFLARGQDVKIRGRGILDGTRCPLHARELLQIQGSKVGVEGIIFRDSSVWNLAIRRSDQVGIENIKILGCRANSDGVDICNSRDVTVRRCFVRTLDDLIVVKTDRGQGDSRRIVVSGCILWNQVAHALSIGAELRENVDDVVLTDCDVINDTGREWTLRVFHCDSARISNVQFSKLRIEESPRLISLWINKALWTRDAERGHIDGVTFDHITAIASPLRIELRGFDPTHAVENVIFRNVVINGQPLTRAEIKSNAFVRNVTIEH